MPSPEERSVCLARAKPSTTGSTASRWLGFEASVTAISPAAVGCMPSAPRWYLTSPVPPSGFPTTAAIVLSPSNSRRISSYGWPTVCASTFSRPRCAMPITTSCAPPDAASSTVSSSIGTITSRPSAENCFWPRKARRRYCSNASARESRSSRARFSSARERLPVAARLDHAAQPAALLVVGDVLDLVGDRAAVGLDEVRQRVGERLAGHVQAECRGGDPRLQLGGQRRLGAVGLERRVADGLGAERVEPRGEVAVASGRRRRAWSRRRRRAGTPCRARPAQPPVRVQARGRRPEAGRGYRRRGVPVAVGAQRLEQPGEAGMRGDELARAALEQAPPLLRNSLGVLEVLLEQRLRVARVQLVDVVHRSDSF